MTNRGEHFFATAPRLTGTVYDAMTRIKAWNTYYKEIAQDLTSKIRHGRLLDIGTGPGRLLLEIHRLNPEIELFGLDIAQAMVQRAKKNLSGIRIDLRQGTIRQTNYESDFFDLVTATGSFYLWDYPVQCLEEIHRILKKNQSAYLFEVCKDFDENEFQQGLRANLQGENLFRRLVMPLFLKEAVQKAYPTAKVAEIIGRTRFADSFVVDRITLSRLPLWSRIELTKR
jgi:ubiquinone/menaquinone biosynthesis C-methylase UbiE